MIRALLKDSAIYAVPSFISRGMALILVPIYTRVLSPEDYGSLDLLIAFMAFINLTVALEVSQGIVHFYSTATNNSAKILYASTGLWFTVACYIIFLITALACSERLSTFVMGRDGLATTFRVGVVYISANGLLILIQNQFRFELRGKQYAACSLICSLSSAMIAVWLVYFMNWGLEGLLFGMLVGTLAGCIYGFWFLKDSFKFHFQGEKLKEMIIFSLPLVPSGIFVFASLYIDRLLINYFLSVHEVGLYGIAFRLASIVGLVMIGFQGALMPLIYHHYKEEATPRQLAKIFRAFIAFAIVTFFVLSVFAQEIFLFVTGPTYHSAAPLVAFLIPAIFLSNMYIFAPGIVIAKKTFLILWINFGGAVLNVAFSWMLIPVLGVTGAAIGTLIGYLFVFSIYMLGSQRLYFVPHEWMPILSSISAAVLILYLVQQVHFSFAHMLILKLLAAFLVGWIILRVKLMAGSDIINALKFLQQFSPVKIM